MNIVLVGKYTDFTDSYTSVVKALEHSAFRVHRKLNLQVSTTRLLSAPRQSIFRVVVVTYLDTHSGSSPLIWSRRPKSRILQSTMMHGEHLSGLGMSPLSLLLCYNDLLTRCVYRGILVPGGFGARGIEGMILAIKWAREQKIPFLGVCLGFQLAVIEWARNVLLLPGAQSTEFEEQTPEPFIIFMPEISKTHMGGTMRLGLRPTVFDSEAEGWSKVRQLYGGVPKIWERHRHRYEVNPAFVEKLVESGLPFVGKDEKGERMQVLELKGILTPSFF